MPRPLPLSREDAALLARTGPGTPAGNLLRGYWQPVALSEDVEPGGPPYPLTVLGEDLVMFRDAVGAPSLIGRYCPHRGVDLSYARAEPGGLRCLYHGWLFDGRGRCLEQPGERPEARFTEQVRHPAYPCVEAAGCVFAYLGPGDPPPLPSFEALTAPTSHVRATRFLYESNYTLGLDHSLDPGHVSFLHLQFPHSERAGVDGPRPALGITGTDLSANALYGRDRAPALETEQTPYGLRVAALRRADEGHMFLRVLDYLHPNVVTAPVVADGYVLQFHVPRDEGAHWRFDVTFDRTGSLADQPGPPPHWRAGGHAPGPVRDRAHRYLQDRTSMGDWFAGMGVFPPDHDGCVLEETWPVAERHREQLGEQDRPLTEVRARLLRAIADHRDHGVLPPAAPDGPLVAFSAVVPEDSGDWRHHLRLRLDRAPR
ncbi:Rieske 2Fe-2S domain-containing protein [Actinocorallia sp. A-T 12471]|uniref:Rieske 2Fe-2S domain-containing protein n=1 Tax=Actinocorallia sp. A-T 12471 TaxID=3089813 RepID=UPI0029CFB6EF|nr:Rieske 2Fe-2S domain-containing protein [Actinocorallia sp. A-T 12471]MDX6740623.1 Rieske 2Fe-2S domain-containing protein [Actinocorallia sp. A-T 12471]